MVKLKMKCVMESIPSKHNIGIEELKQYIIKRQQDVGMSWWQNHNNQNDEYMIWLELTEKYEKWYKSGI